MNIDKLKKVRDYVCKGCGSYINKDYISDRKLAVCTVVHKKNGQVCPCSQCLVKSMCESQCDEFKDYSNKKECDPKRLIVATTSHPYPWEYKDDESLLQYPGIKQRGGRFGASSRL